MKISSGNSNRAAFYDRNPTTINNQLQALGVAPHAGTARFSYTVPSGRKAWFEAATAWARVVTVATTNGRRIIFFDRSGPVNPFPLQQIVHVTNTVDTITLLNVSQLGLGKAGDVFRAVDSDSSTGGTVDYEEDFAFQEFDA